MQQEYIIFPCNPRLGIGQNELWLAPAGPKRNGNKRR
jgi:hypothetical protein